jgi:hypothetical protein
MAYIQSVTGIGHESRTFWRWTALALGLLAFGKGIRQPNLWSYTQAQFNYSAGFTRRGFFGFALGRPLELNLYGHFAAVSTALLLLLFAMIALLARRAKLAERALPGELLAVYASSYSVTYLAHINGYFDIPLALLCIAPLFVRPAGWRLAGAAACTTVGMLIHEQFFFAFLPILIISVAFGAATGETPAQRRLALAGAAALGALGIALLAYVARDGSISTAQAAQLQESISRTADHPLAAEAFKVLPRTSRENAGIMRSVWSRPTFIPAQIESLLLFGPSAAVLSWATFILLRRWRPGVHRWLYAGVLLATLAPLSLNLFGWDKNRWNELLCLNAFLALLIVTKQLCGEPIQLPLRLRQACLLVILLNMATGGGMLDDRHIRPFPFLRNPDANALSEPYSMSNQP